MSHLLRAIRRGLDATPTHQAAPTGAPKALRPGFRNATAAKQHARLVMLRQAFEAGYKAALPEPSKPSLLARMASRVARVFKSAKGR